MLEGSNNPYRSAVVRDIVDAILVERADGRGSIAKYWGKEDQEIRLQRVFEKWLEHGSVWSEASTKVRELWLAYNYI